jgi:very-short-patch-repair endonuclease
MTEAEKILWKRLRRKQIDGYHFRAQYQIDLFIADFYCHRLKLIIELDGEVHSNEDQRQYDEGRTAELERLGIKVIRFRNKQVLQNPDTVEDEIKQVCQVR